MKVTKRDQFKKTKTKQSLEISYSDSSTRTVLEWMGSLSDIQTILSPADYFSKFFNQDIMIHIVYHSNLYATVACGDLCD